MNSHRCPARTLAFGFLTAGIAFAQEPVVNAPVAPDTIYVARAGAQAGISVIDLNGFGASTGDPTYDPTGQTFQEGWSNYAYNPNLVFNGPLLGLTPPTSTLNGGSSGVFTLTRNSALDDVLIRSPHVQAISDMMIGAPLDLIFNVGPPPFGCTSGTPNLCASNSLKLIVPVPFGENTVAPGIGTSPAGSQVGLGNAISFAPSPNPPALSDVAPCFAPAIGGAEPVSVDAPVVNLLGPGDPFGDPLNGVPPSGLLVKEQNSFFVGPSASAVQPGNCSTYAIRQHVGHLLYVVDRRQKEVVVLNSNTFAVLDSIATADPSELAMSPRLDLLAVTNRAADSVSFINIDPSSPNFHSIVKTVQVGDKPLGIAWDSGNEDILVCNEGSNSVSIISAFTLDVRKTVRGGLQSPFAIAITQRQEGFGFDREVYFAYVLDRAGKVTLFESGPNGAGGTAGWGFDRFIGQTEFAFAKPRAIQPDPLSLTSAVWIAHEGQLDANGQPTALTGGALTKLALDSTTTGKVLLQPGELPNLRGLSFEIELSIGSDQLTGSPLDIAFDNQRNFGALVDMPSSMSGSQPAPINGKSQVRMYNGAIANTSEPAYLFVPTATDAATAGGLRLGSQIDVIDLATGLRIDTNAFQPGIQSIPAEGARCVADYFRQ